MSVQVNILQLNNGVPITSPVNGFLYIVIDEVDYCISYDDLVKFLTADLAFLLPATISFSTTISFSGNKIMTGKTLESNDVFSIAASPVEGTKVKTWLIGNGTHEPDFSAFDYVNGSYDSDSDVRNVIEFEYFGGKSYVFIKNIYP